MGLYAEMMKQRPPTEARLFDARVRMEALRELNSEYSATFKELWDADLASVKKLLDSEISFPLDNAYRRRFINEQMAVFTEIASRILQDLRDEVKADPGFLSVPDAGQTISTGKKDVDKKIEEIAVNYVFNLITTIRPDFRNTENRVISMFYNKLIGIGSVHHANDALAFDKEYEDRLFILLTLSNMKELPHLHAICGDAYFRDASLNLLSKNTAALIFAINTVNTSRRETNSQINEDTQAALKALEDMIEKAILSEQDPDKKAMIEHYAEAQSQSIGSQIFDEKYNTLQPQERSQFILTLLSLGNSGLEPALVNQNLEDLYHLDSSLFQRSQLYDSFPNYSLLRDMLASKINQLKPDEERQLNQAGQELLLLAQRLEKGSEKYLKKYAQKDKKTGKTKKNFGTIFFKVHVPEHQRQADDLQKLSAHMKAFSNPPIDKQNIVDSLSTLYEILEKLSPKKGNLKRYIGYSSIDDQVKDILLLIYPHLKTSLESNPEPRESIVKLLREITSSLGEKELGKNEEEGKEKEKKTGPRSHW